MFEERLTFVEKESATLEALAIRWQNHSRDDFIYLQSWRADNMPLEDLLRVQQEHANDSALARHYLFRRMRIK